MGDRGHRTELARVLGRVVRAEVQAQLRHHRFILGGIAGRREVGHHVEQRGVLATEGHAAHLGAFQADVSLTTEQAATLLRAPVIQAETAFHHEQRLQAAAQVFHAAQAPTRTGQAAGRHAEEVLRRAGRKSVGRRRRDARHIAHVLDVGIHHTVERDARLGLRRPSKCAKRCQRQKRFLHAR
ncbi:hypothetical protein D3C72_1283130 [compost metagenome]